MREATWTVTYLRTLGKSGDSRRGTNNYQRWKGRWMVGWSPSSLLWSLNYYLSSFRERWKGEKHLAASPQQASTLSLKALQL